MNVKALSPVTARRTILFIILLGFGLRVYRLDAQSMWWDELYTVVRSTMTIGELMENLFEARVHLPLYFVLLRGWVEIGLSAFILRYFSVVAGVLAIPLIYVTGRRLNGPAVGLVAAFLLAIIPFHIWFSQEARMYTFLALNTLAANYFLLRLLHRERRSDWLAYTIALTLMLYSHYLGVFILIAHYTFFSLHYRQNPDRFKRWFICGSIAGALFAVWFMAVFLISSFIEAPINWITAASWYEPLVTLFTFSIGPSVDPATFLPYVAFLTYLVGVMATYVYIGRRAGSVPTSKLLSLRLLWLWFSLPLLLLTLISIDWSIPNQRFIYMDRYLIGVLPAFVLLAAWGLVLLSRQHWSPRWLLPLLLGLILVPTLFTWHNLYFNPGYARENWRGAFNQISMMQQEGDILLMTVGPLLPYSYYGRHVVKQDVLPSLAEFDEIESESQACIGRSQCAGLVLQERLELHQADVDRVWMIAAFDNPDKHGFPQVRNAAAASETVNEYEQWLAEHYEVVDRWLFAGVRLTLYDLNQPE